jgi:hypothetical protein
MLQIYDVGLTALLPLRRKASLRIFIARKNRLLPLVGVEPATPESTVKHVTTR